MGPGGVYPATIELDVSQPRIDRYFQQEEDGRYRVNTFIRDMLVFAPQNIIRDPPFTKLDLLSCRNLLIYLGPELQQKLLPLFQYCLKPNGILFLGSSESIGQSTDLFATCDKKWRIFRRTALKASNPGISRFPISPDVADDDVYSVANLGPSSTSEEVDTLRLVESILAQSEAPPCIVVDDALNLIFVHGHTGKFLEPSQGRVTLNVLKMARPGVRKALVAAIHKVAMYRQEVIHSGLSVIYGGEQLSVDLIAKPILDYGPMRGLTLVIFREVAQATQVAPIALSKKTGYPLTKTLEDMDIELQYTKEYLQMSIEEFESSNEELKSTNEELQSTNEELQSTIEELETSKEELQSLHEESMIVNAELLGKNEELSRANDDLNNLLNSTNIATIFLDLDLRIRRFTPLTKSIIPLEQEDIGRPLRHFSSTLVDFDISGKADVVLENLNPYEGEVMNAEGRIYTIRIRPYRTQNNVINGAVVTFQDVTDLSSLRISANSLAVERDFASRILDSLKSLVLVLDMTGRIERFNNECRELTGFSEDEVVGKHFWDVLLPEKTTLAAKQEFETFHSGELPLTSHTIWRAKDGALHHINWTITRIKGGTDKALYFLGTGQLAVASESRNPLN